jgi:hypothetical protein
LKDCFALAAWQEMFGYSLEMLKQSNRAWQMEAYGHKSQALLLRHGLKIVGGSWLQL